MPTRHFMSDVPSTEVRRKLGVIRAQVTEHLYTVSIDNATVSAYLRSPTALARGTEVPLAWHPQRRFWEIELYPAGGEDVEYLVFRSYDEDWNDEVFRIAPVRDYAVGFPKISFGTEFDSNGGIRLRCAVSKDGEYMVEIAGDDAPEYGILRMYLWDAANEVFGPAVHDELFIAAEFPDTYVTSIDLNSAGDLVVRNAAPGEPHVLVYQTSAAGFGTRYADPSPAILDLLMENEGQVIWHPNGTAIGFAASGSFGEGDGNAHILGFTPGVGFTGVSFEFPNAFPFFELDPGFWDKQAFWIEWSLDGAYVVIQASNMNAPEVDAAIFGWDDVTGVGAYVELGPVPIGSGGTFTDRPLAVSNTHVYVAVETDEPFSGEDGVAWFRLSDGVCEGTIRSGTPGDNFDNTSIYLSPSGRFIAKHHDSWGEISIYNVADDGSLSVLTIMFEGYGPESIQLGWRVS